MNIQRGIKMSNKLLKLKGKIENVIYKPMFRTSKLKEYDFHDFNVNSASSYGFVNFHNESRLAYSYWVSPKRTRSYPLSRVYSTYHAEKRVTIIPIVKDEGIGGEHDRINFITLSWLNLMNVYILLAWYDSAEKHKTNSKKITKQQFNNDYIKQQFEKIQFCHTDAHHWNREHFEKEFPYVMEKAVESYKRIEKETGVQLHNQNLNLNFLNEVTRNEHNNLLDFDKFKEKTLKTSQLAALRESNTNHKFEFLSSKSQKGIFAIENYLGGEYNLTCDEIIFENKDSIIIQESKNSTTQKLASADDIKDGLFKLILFSNLDTLKLNDKNVNYRTRLMLTGNIDGCLSLPAENTKIDEFILKNGFSDKQNDIIRLLNLEAQENDISIVIKSNN